MIAKILWWFLALIVLTFLFVWIWTGGPKKAWHEAQSMSYFGASSTPFRLPGQPAFPQGPEIDPNSIDRGAAGGGNTTQDLRSQLATYEDQFNDLNQQAIQAKTFGNPSPLRGKVLIVQTSSPQENNPSNEYLQIQANGANTSPINMTGWSLQSAYTGIRSYIPNSASPFIMGAVNKQEPTELEPGDSAVIVSGGSPVGISFRENICTGYLMQLQNFSPSLNSMCPLPSSALSLTPDNLRIYGESCLDFLQTIPQCTFPFQMPSNVSPRCASFVANTLSYNGCVSSNRYHSSFGLSVWRVYLNSPTELWRNSHDIIRLLDREGRTVDVITY